MSSLTPIRGLGHVRQPVFIQDDQFKTGEHGTKWSERIAKYNSLLEIEQDLGDSALYYW